MVMEASDNSFAACETIRAHCRKAVVLESKQCAKIGKRYCANDRTDAVKLARLYISGLAGKVWVPDMTTRLRREVFYTYQQAVCDTTRARQRIRSFLNQHRIRLEQGFRLTSEASLARLLALRVWEPTQQLLLSQHHQALLNANLRRTQLREVMAAELLKEPAILRLIRLCGLRHIAAFALAAFIGDIRRFAGPKQLVAYIGLNPSVCESGNSKGSTHLRKHGCAPLRSLLVQAAQMILRVPQAPFAQWGYKLVIRRGRNRATIGVARKLATAVWYCLSGAFSAMDEIEPMVDRKLNLLVNACGSLKERILGDLSPQAYMAQMLLMLQKSHPLVFSSVP
ncbi:MAG: IS110 family transposase [Chthoniobacteraceae bacterium]